MARFIVAHRLANRPADASRSNFEAASSKLRSFADVKVAARPSPGGRGLMVIDTDSADLSRKAREFSPDVITEPELQRYPSTTVGAALRGGPGDTAVPAGMGTSVQITVRQDSAPVAGALSALSVRNRMTGASASVVATTDDDGAASFQYDATFWVPVMMTVNPVSGAWPVFVASPGANVQINVPPLPRTGPLGWWHRALGINAFDANTGSGIRVGVADTGLSDHPYLAHVQNIGAFVDGAHDTSPGAGADVENHGTHVTGIIGARPPAGSTDFGGIAPGAEILAARVYQRSPGTAGPQGLRATNGDIALAIDTFVESNVNLINLSLGGFQSSLIELDAIQHAMEKGVLTICSAGNEMGGPVTFPAAYSETLAVSAVGMPWTFPAAGVDSLTVPSSLDRYSSLGLYCPSFVSVGPAVNCTGPGVAIISTVPGAANGGPPYAAMSGTSMAAPSVCAALATVLSRDPEFAKAPPTVDKVARAVRWLIATVRNLGLRPDFAGLGLPAGLAGANRPA